MEMSNLEKLLLKINEVKTLTEEQTNEALKTAVLQNETKRFIEESKKLIKEDSLGDDENDYDEEVVSDPTLDVADSGKSPSDMDSSSLDGDTGDVDIDMPSDDTDAPDLGVDTPTKMGNMDEPTEMDDDVLDLSNASIEEVMEALENLPNNTVIEIKKNPPSFDFSTSNDMSMDEPLTESEDDYEEEEEEEDEDEENDEKKLEEEINEWLQEELQESVNQKLINEYKVIVEQYEKKLSKIQSKHRAEITKLQESRATQAKELSLLKEEHKKYENALQQSSNILEEQALQNTKLLHITKLFTEQVVSRDEKVQIAKQFDKVKTINESVVLYNALSTNLPKNNTNVLSEEMKQIKDDIKGKKEIIKEQKTFNDPYLKRFDDLVNHKI